MKKNEEVDAPLVVMSLGAAAAALGSNPSFAARKKSSGGHVYARHMPTRGERIPHSEKS